jgi:hypothetical protein
LIFVFSEAAQVADAMMPPTRRYPTGQCQGKRKQVDVGAEREPVTGLYSALIRSRGRQPAVRCIAIAKTQGLDRRDGSACALGDVRLKS